MVTKTELVEDNYFGKPIVKIYKKNEDGTYSEKPVVSFGLKKAEAIIDHMEEIKRWYEENKK